MRIGTGYDVHKFCEDRPLIIGGVTIPYEKGLLGHSDDQWSVFTEFMIVISCSDSHVISFAK